MNHLIDSFDAIARSEHPDAIMHEVNDIMGKQEHWCSELNSYGYAECIDLFASLAFNLTSDERTPTAIRLLVSTLGAIFYHRGQVDKHPLEYSPGSFSEDADLSSVLAEFCMDISMWNDKQIEIAAFLNHRCEWCMMASTCIVAWWWGEVNQPPPWIPIWLNRLDTFSHNNAMKFRNDPIVKKQIRLSGLNI